VPQRTLAVLKVDSGASAASAGWGPDQLFGADTVTRDPPGVTVAGVNAAADASADVYTSYRLATRAAGVVPFYEAPLANGSYTVRLHFAEMYFGAQPSIALRAPKSQPDGARPQCPALRARACSTFCWRAPLCSRASIPALRPAARALVGACL
jgi:hypothetical protein